jgi:hypothetical protein
MRVLSRIEIVNVPAANSDIAPQDEKLETVRSDKGQATMENFLSEEKD